MNYVRWGWGLLLVTALACGGESRSEKVEEACEHVCYCFDSGSSGSSGIGSSSGDCVSECVQDVNSGSDEVPDDCLDCVTDLTCGQLSGGSAECDDECDVGSGSGSSFSG